MENTARTGDTLTHCSFKIRSLNNTTKRGVFLWFYIAQVNDNVTNIWQPVHQSCRCKINDENMKKIIFITGKLGDTVIEYAPQQIQQ